MEINDEAIILSSRKYGENSGIVTAITKNHGLYKGLVKGITSTKQRGIYQQGNIVELVWRARLAEHLGNISASLLSTNLALIMTNPTKLAALSSICSILELTIQEREAVSEIYFDLQQLLNNIKYNNYNWKKDYILLELKLLAQLGFGLDLSSCAANGSTQNLAYISPKSGRAVSLEAGAPYANKLFNLPEFIISNSTNISQQQIKEGLMISGYFLEKYFFQPHNIKSPTSRIRFVEMAINNV